MYEVERVRNQIRSDVERAHRFSGWRFGDLAPKPLELEEPWSYPARAEDLLRHAKCVLDMGTGGGELFGDLCSSYAGRAVATEPWSMNVPIAAERLQPHGIEVVQADSLRLPFRGERFDLVLNRHEELDPVEVARVVAPGGCILTQQIGRNRWHELREFFPRMQDFGDLFHRYREGLDASGLTIVRAGTHDWKAAYQRLGDIVFLLCIAPWEIADFDPLGRDLPALCAAEESLSTDDGIVLTESLFLIEARKEGR